MQIYSTYSVKIKHYNQIFKETTAIYRKAVDFFINVALDKWNELSVITKNLLRVNIVESYTIKTKKNPSPEYDFSVGFYKFPSYLRRAAIMMPLVRYHLIKATLQTGKMKTKLPVERCLLLVVLVTHILPCIKTTCLLKLEHIPLK